MQVPKQHPPCYSGVCGLAMACIDEKCGPCSKDFDCLNDEVCVFQHCVLEENVSCRTKNECEEDDALCVLNGYSSGVRGNADMKAFCRSSSGGEPQVQDLEERRRFDAERGPFQPAAVEFTDLAKGLIYEKDR